MKGDFHVRFCGNVRAKFPCMTRLCASGRKRGRQSYGNRDKLETIAPMEAKPVKPLEQGKINHKVT